MHKKDILGQYAVPNHLRVKLGEILRVCKKKKLIIIIIDNINNN